MGKNVANIVHHKILENCRIPYNVETNLSTDDEISKYDYLTSIGFLCHDTLWHVCASMMAESFDNEENAHAMSKKQLAFCRSKIQWLLNHETCKNYVSMKKMPLDMISKLKQLYDERNWNIEILSDIEMLMRNSGCKYVQECDQNEVFWRQFKPGLYGELPFKVNFFRSRVTTLVLNSVKLHHHQKVL